MLTEPLVTPPPERVGRRSADRAQKLTEDDIRGFLDRNQEAFK
jgi:hypothetical protein